MPELIWYGHSCFKLDFNEGGSIVFDPYKKGSVPGAELPEEVCASIVHCSHGHDDHNAAERIRLTGDIPLFRLTTLESFHDEVGGAKRGPNKIVIAEYNGFRAAHLGDLGCMPTDEQLAALRGVDLLLIPVGGCFTIGPKEAKALLDRIQPRIAVPMHYRRGTMGYPVLNTLEDFTAQYEAWTELLENRFTLSETTSGLYVLNV